MSELEPVFTKFVKTLHPSAETPPPPQAIRRYFAAEVSHNRLIRFEIHLRSAFSTSSPTFIYSLREPYVVIESIFIYDRYVNIRVCGTIFCYYASHWQNKPMTAKNKLDKQLKPHFVTQLGNKTPAVFPSRGHRNREVTRAKLIDAAERVVARKGVDGTAIADITEAADVAIGSFYNNFATKTEVIEIIFLRHAENLAQLNALVFDQESDPALAISYIQKVFFTKAIADPVWGWFVVHASSILPSMWNVFAKTAVEHVKKGMELGRLNVADPELAVRIILVSLVAGMRDLMEGHAKVGLPNRLVQSLLQMLGVPPAEALVLSNKKLPSYVTRIFNR